jgi:plastocyanin
MRKGLVCAFAALLLLAACGSSKNSSSGSNSNSKPPVQLSGTVTDKGTQTASGGSISIQAGDFAFTPTFVKAPAGSMLTVNLKNVGQNEHTFTIDSAHVDKTLPIGASMTVTVTVPSSGSLNFYCRFHRGTGMQGAIVAE